MPTNKKLLQLFVTIVYAKLFKTVHVENLEAINIQHADQRAVSFPLVAVVYVDRTVDA